MSWIQTAEAMYIRYQKGIISESDWKTYATTLLEVLLETNADVLERLKNERY